MNDLTKHRQDISSKGYSVINDVFNDEEIGNILDAIRHGESSNPTFRKGAGLFAIRQFLNEIQVAKEIILKSSLKAIIEAIFGKHYFPVKSIYFDKPEQSNWFVSWHQDLTISVNNKAELSGYSNWTVKQNQFAVQPPIEILKDNFTIRIHLDETDKYNGALKVIPGSHHNGIYRHDNIDLVNNKVEICDVRKGGIMIMRPLLMHASDRTTNNEKRRVIHIEFSRFKLPEGINWSEAIQ